MIEAIDYTFHKVFDRENFGKSVYGKLNTQFNAESWESVLKEVLKSLYPHAQIERRGGRKEIEHGTDITIAIPGLSDTNHVIAVQVKDYKGEVSESDIEQIIEQINKASYWNQGGDKLIEKVVIFTRAKRSKNSRLVEIGDQHDVKFVFAEDLRVILTRYAMRCMGLDDSD